MKRRDVIKFAVRPMKRIYKCRIAFAFTVFVITGCNSSSVEVKDFPSWCRYIHDPKMGRYDSFSINKEAVIEGLVSTWDRIVLENSAELLGIPQKEIESDSSLAELRKIRAVGAWREGETLHFGLTLVIPPIIDRSRTDAEILAHEYSTRMTAAAQSDGEKQMAPDTYCLYEGINVFFARLTVHATDGESSIENAMYEKHKTDY